MARSLVNYIRSLRRFPVTNKVSVVKLANYCGKVPPVLVSKIITGQCRGERPGVIPSIDFPENDNPANGGGIPTHPTNPNNSRLPTLPEYVHLDEGVDLIVDFSSPSGIQITIPTLVGFPQQLPLTEEGAPIYPDNFCGIRANNATGFQWFNDSGEVIEFDEVYNYKPDLNTPNFLEVTGPIGACGGRWHFEFPLTKTRELSPANPNVKLVIENVQTIEFLDYNLESQVVEPFPAKLFKTFSNNAIKLFWELLKYLIVRDTRRDIFRDKEKIKEILRLSPVYDSYARIIEQYCRNSSSCIVEPEERWWDPNQADWR